MAVKWIVLCGLGFGVLRFALSALNTKAWLLLGVGLHGASFTLVCITGANLSGPARGKRLARPGAGVDDVHEQRRGQPHWLPGTGGWFALCAKSSGESRPLFWGGLSAAVVVVMMYFLTYHGRGKALFRL